MEEHLKYFVPEISDLCIDYELEVNYNFKFNDIFHKKIIDCFEELSDIHSRMSGDCVIRVPYLTKEQIEAEGFVEMKAPILTILKKFRDIPFEKNEYRLDYNSDFKELLITKKLQCLYYGKCKDINTLRKICKLLGI